MKCFNVYLPLHKNDFCLIIHLTGWTNKPLLADKICTNADHNYCCILAGVARKTEQFSFWVLIVIDIEGLCSGTVISWWNHTLLLNIFASINKFCSLIGHVNNIPNAIFHWNFQKYSVKIIYAIIDWVCLGFPK